MKNITILLLVIFGIGLVSSCKKEPKEPVLDMSKTQSATITAPVGKTLVLLEDQADSTINFTWTAAVYNLTDLETTTYLLQMDTVGDNFNKPTELTSTSDLSFSITVGGLNGKLKAVGIPTDTPTSVEFRVVSFINNTTETTDAYSSVISNTFSTYAGGVIEYPKLYVPGDYQGWAPADAPVIQSFDSDGIYTGYIYFPDDEGATFEFKFTSDPDWDHTNYGAGANEGELDTDAGAGNLTVPGPGGYRVTVDVNNLTWTYELQNWGVIGEFNAWAEDIKLEWDAENNYLTLTTDIPAAVDNRFKFRANDAWDINYGAIDPPDGKTLTQGGGDIPITEGNWTFHLILSGKDPMYELIEN
jgi:starch-binding outer membrane protein SusE/F